MPPAASTPPPAFPAGPLPPADAVMRRMPCLCGSLLTAGRAVARLYAEELRGSGIEPTQYGLLRLLDSLGPLPQRLIGDYLAADKTTVSRNLRVMQRSKLVSTRHGEDRRERIVHLTPTGRERLHAATPHWERAQARLRASLTGPRWDELRALLPTMTAAALRA